MDLNQYIPHLDPNYKKGYDQLTNGINTNFIIDYIYFEKKNRLKIYAGFDYSLAFTKNRRAYDLFRKRTVDVVIAKYDKQLKQRLQRRYYHCHNYKYFRISALFVLLLLLL